MKTLLVLALAAGSLFAQPAGSPDDAERLTAAKRLVEVMELAKAIETSMAASQEAVGNNLVESLMRTNPAFEKFEGEQRTKMLDALRAMTKRLQDKMQAALNKEMNVGEEVGRILAPVYAGHFTTAELRKLIEFYESPLGRKLALAAVETQPEISPADASPGCCRA